MSESIENMADAAIIQGRRCFVSVHPVIGIVHGILPSKACNTGIYRRLRWSPRCIEMRP